MAQMVRSKSDQPDVQPDEGDQSRMQTEKPEDKRQSENQLLHTSEVTAESDQGNSARTEGSSAISLDIGQTDDSAVKDDSQTQSTARTGQESQQPIPPDFDTCRTEAGATDSFLISTEQQVSEAGTPVAILDTGGLTGGGVAGGGGDNSYRTDLPIPPTMPTHVALGAPSAYDLGSCSPSAAIPIPAQVGGTRADSPVTITPSAIGVGVAEVSVSGEDTPIYGIGVSAMDTFGGNTGVGAYTDMVPQIIPTNRGSESGYYPTGTSAPGATSADALSRNLVMGLPAGDQPGASGAGQDTDMPGGAPGVDAESQGGEAPSGRPITHGDVLEAVALACADLPVTPSQAAAIQSAEAKALGMPGGAGGLGAAARSAAILNSAPPSNPSSAFDELITMGDVLKDARSKLARDKEVTPEDAIAVKAAESRNNAGPDEQQIGVGAVEVQAAILNT